MAQDQFDIDDLIIRYLSGETTHFENRSFIRWKNESTENLAYFNSLRDTWLASAQTVPPEISIHPEIGIPSFTKQKEHDFRNNSLRQLLRIAAVFALLVIAGVVMYNSLGNKASLYKSSKITVEATMGSKAITTLPDGTNVWLNSGSKLMYDGSYNDDNREVSLTGEAYFNVIANATNPFVVKTGKLSIKALGTKFNVKAYPEDSTIVTTLVQGNVIIEGKDERDKGFTVQMKPKETVTFFKGSRPLGNSSEEKFVQQNQSEDPITKDSDDVPVEKIEDVRTELFVSWKDDRWVIENQKLVNLVRDIERRYNIKINFSSESIKQFHFTGILENETIEQVMLIMRHTIPLKYKIEKGVITIDEDAALMKKFYNRKDIKN